MIKFLKKLFNVKTKEKSHWSVQPYILPTGNYRKPVEKNFGNNLLNPVPTNYPNQDPEL